MDEENKQKKAKRTAVGDEKNRSPKSPRSKTAKKATDKPGKKSRVKTATKSTEDKKKSASATKKKTESKAKTKTSTKSKVESKAKAKIQPKAESRTKALAKLTAKTKPKTNAALKQKAKANASRKPKTKAKPKVNAKQEPSAKVKTKANAKLKPSAKAKTEATAKLKPSAKSKTKANAKLKPSAKSKPAADAKLKPNAKSKPEANAKLKPSAKAKPKTNAKPKAKRETRTKALAKLTAKAKPKEKAKSKLPKAKNKAKAKNKNQQKLSSTLAQKRKESIAEVAYGSSPTAVPPHHLMTMSFVNHSHEVALFAYAAMKDAVNILKKDKGRKNVHDIRVSFRRWFSIWNVLQDSWDSKDFKESIGDDLRRAYKALGGVRDWDVVVKLANQAMVPQIIIDKMEKRRDRARDRSFKVLKNLKLGKLIGRLEKYLKRQYESLSEELAASTEPAKSAYKQLEEFLEHREIATRELLSSAKTLKELHQVRLSIKAWRYLLAEFFGLSSVELVRAQQLLGQLNDIDRLKEFLLDHNKDGVEEPIENLMAESEKLLEGWSELKLLLPFGLRPYICRMKDGSEGEEESHSAEGVSENS